MPLDLVVPIQWIMIYSLDGTVQHLKSYELFCKMTFVVFVLHSFIFFEQTYLGIYSKSVIILLA